MEKKYLAKIIAYDNEGLQMISACCSGAKIKVNDIKFLKKNKVFLISLIRNNNENQNNKKKINSICKFDFVDDVKSKNINQKDQKLLLDLIGINYFKRDKNYEISLIFNNNAYITLFTEIIEATLEDQNEI